MPTTEWPTEDAPGRVPFLVRQVELLRQSGVEVMVYAFRGSKNPYNYFIALLELRRCIRSFKPDFIHAQWGQSALPVIFSKLPLVTTFRGSDLLGITMDNGDYSWKGKVLHWLSRQVARKAVRIILVSRSLRERLPASVQHKVEVLPTGVNLERFKPMSKSACRAALQLPVDKKLVLFGGDPTRADKRFGLANSAMEIVRKTVDAQLVVTHRVDPSEMPSFINACDVVLLTSRHEGSPNIVKEALACNRPVVSVDVGDVKERLERVFGSALVENSTPEAIANAVVRVLESDLDNYESREAVLDVEETIINSKILRIYNNVLGL